MEKYKKLIEKQRELINLLDEAVDDMTELGYETREILFGEINNIEKEIEELESKFIGEQTITGDFSSVSFQQKEVSAEEILNKIIKK